MKADHEKVIRLMKTARGQIDGLLKMMEEDRYCLDISNQLLATQAILRKINEEILSAHLHTCVKQAFEQGEADQKIEELMGLLRKMTK